MHIEKKIKLNMEMKWTTFPIIVFLVLYGSFINLECWSLEFVDVTYEDIANLNATCGELYFCESPRETDSLQSYNCNCNSYCSLLGTCCVDSKYRNKYPKPLKHLHCDTVFQNETFYYLPMVYGCDPDVQSDSITEELCNSNAELSNNPFLNVPVTDPVTGISYKNFYCYACNKKYSEGEKPIPWNLDFESQSEKINVPIRKLNFDVSRWVWIMDYDQANATDVYLSISIPEKLKTIMPYCYNFKIISECHSNWTDDGTIRSKCLSYMALTRIYSLDDDYETTFAFYRNPHCAICNYQNMNNIDCGRSDGLDASIQGVSFNNFFYGLFSFHDKKRCEENMVYDSFGNKCRKVFKAQRKTEQ